MVQLGRQRADTTPDSRDSAAESRAPEPHHLDDAPGMLDRADLERVHAFWRAANYLSVGQRHLLDNALLRDLLQPELVVRVVNVVDLMRLLPEAEHPHGLPDREFDTLFTEDRPVIFAFHGYPWLVHRLTYHRRDHSQIHVRGYKERGTTTTPFDMVMTNDLDRYHLVMDVAIGCLISGSEPRVSGRRWSICASGHASGLVNMASICQMSPVGTGRGRRCCSSAAVPR